MAEREEIDRVIVDSLHVDEEGYKHVKCFEIAEIKKLGVVDIPLFLQGMLDGENDKDFSESSKDYVKGYSYAKTGKF